VRVTVVRPGELGAEEARLWAKFQQLSPVTLSPFLSFAFTEAVGRFRPNSRIAVVEEGGRIEAFLPFELASKTLAVPIGEPMNDLHGFVHSGIPLDARWVVKQAGLRGWRFGHVPAEQSALIPYHYEGTVTENPAINLGDGYESYFGKRSKSLTAKIMRQRRSLERRVGNVSLQWHSSQAEESLRQLIAWKSTKYHGTKVTFSDPTALRILEALGTMEDENCRGIVSVLSAAERPVAINLGLTGPRGLTGWFSAYDRELSRFSPGTMLILAVAEEAANRGIGYFDLGYGQDSYKFRLANMSYPVAGGAVWASRGEQFARRVYRRLRQRSATSEQAGRKDDGAASGSGDRDEDS
jgi:CelD/BcsL family acetyltransferase involved in cellulose biosynthesis